MRSMRRCRRRGTSIVGSSWRKRSIFGNKLRKRVSVSFCGREREVLSLMRALFRRFGAVWGRFEEERRREVRNSFFEGWNHRPGRILSLFSGCLRLKWILHLQIEQNRGEKGTSATSKQENTSLMSLALSTPTSSLLHSSLTCPSRLLSLIPSHRAACSDSSHCTLL